jgi:50S ribosomal protein L16 3-hydroxylase
MSPAPLGELSVERFLADHWQKRPLVVRGALPALAADGPPLTPDELAGLACEDEVESRLVRSGAARARGEPEWVLEHGPFAESRFADLPEHDWALLVQDCEKHVPELAMLVDPFRFVPDWRIDDLMVSYATDGGGVGPHVDQYDVFLVQGLGRRRWRVGAAGQDAAERDDLDLRVLARFAPVEEWVLEPGDLLYLPPGVPHEGTALGECMTFSIGFRAPATREMWSDLAELLYQGIDPAARYADPGLRAADARPHGRIAPEALATVRAALRRHLAPRDAELDAWFARFITEPKPQLRAAAPGQAFDPEALAEELRGGAGLVRDPRSRWAWLVDADGALLLAVDGEVWPASAGLRPLVELLCRERRLPAGALRAYLDDAQARALLAALHAWGALDLEGP